MANKYITNISGDGGILGANATSLLGFFGTTPIVRPTVSANATNSATTITQLNLLITALGNLGIITPAA